MHTFDIHPVNLIKALSMALELAVNGMSKHHWRTALIAKQLAEKIPMTDAEEQTLLYAALMHDIGAASNWNERRRLKDLEHAAPADIHRHSENGYELLKDSAKFGALAIPIRFHHYFWNGENPLELKGGQIPLASRIIHVADRIEVLLDERELIFAQKDRIKKHIAAKSGRDFDPDVVDAFLECAKRESFWLDLINPNYHTTFFESLNVYGATRYTLADATQIAEIFATIIDRTSAFTATHSRSVAKISVLLAKIRGFSADEIIKMQIAGLLHDLGKLAIPNEILEKPGSLTRQEVMVIRQHTYYTYHILKQIDHFGDIAKWAAYHHETLDGLGYPFRIAGDSLPLGSRIVAVADVFVALTENRPYREGLSEDKSMSILRSMAKNRKLDEKIVGDLTARYPEAAALMPAARTIAV